MAKKNVWLTWMPRGDIACDPEQHIGLLNQYGFGVSGNYWINDLKKMAWTELANKLIDASGPDLWIIAGNQEDFESDHNRYGLSMVTATVSEVRDVPLQGICLGMDFDPAYEAMPTLLRSFECMSGMDAGWPSKVVSAAVLMSDWLPSVEF